MVDPTGWRAEKDGSEFGFTDPSNYQPSVGPIAFSGGGRVAGGGNQSLEFDPPSNVNNTPKGVLIDESSDADAPLSVQMDACSPANSGGPSAGLVFAFQDQDNYLTLEIRTSDFTAVYGEVTSGSYNRESLGSEGPALDNSSWAFMRLQVYSAGANDLRLKASVAELGDFQANGENALQTSIDYRTTPPIERNGSVGLAFAHTLSGSVVWLDGIELYWA